MTLWMKAGWRMAKKIPLTDNLYSRIRGILESARSNVARSVNSTQVVANWLIGREIVEQEQRGKGRAGYGKGLLAGIARRLGKDYGAGFSVSALQYMRAMYVTYPRLLEKQHAVRVELPPAACPPEQIQHSLRVASSGRAIKAKAGMVAREEPPIQPVFDSQHREPWRPGQLHPNLSWTHYRTLLRVEDAQARSFYEIEAVDNSWSARELERQINSLLYERLALSKDKKGLLKLARKGQRVQTPADVFKDPVVLEFLGLPESPRLVESDLEQSLIDNLQTFLLELGKGFAFVARQQRLTLDGDHFYIDLVFYHTILKCYIVIDLKTGKLTHQDIGQLQLYVNYYDRECRTDGDGPTLGLILCTDKNDTVVRYTLSEHQSRTIFASRYRLYVPSVAELKAELLRELRTLRGGQVVGSGSANQ